MNESEKSFDTLNHEQRIEYARASFPAIGQYCCANRQYYIDIWDIAEDSGFHLILADHHSPIPSRQNIRRVAERKQLIEPDEIGFDSGAQKEHFLRLTEYQEELAGIPFKTGESNEFCWANGMFPIADAYLYYSIIRQERPERIVEVGSGQSTLIALQALKKNGGGNISCIEPNPNQFFNTHLAGISGSNYRLLVEELQNVPLSLFRELRQNDILFIDSSHVVKAQSDLTYFFFKILPSLADGVFVHVHDIFLPFDYPLDFFTFHKRFYTEEYVLAAFLMQNRRVKTMVSNYYFLWQEYGFYLREMATLLEDIKNSAEEAGECFDPCELFVTPEMPLRPHLMGGSYWMRI